MALIIQVLTTCVNRESFYTSKNDITYMCSQDVQTINFTIIWYYFGIEGYVTPREPLGKPLLQKWRNVPCTVSITYTVCMSLSAVWCLTSMSLLAYTGKVQPPRVTPSSQRPCMYPLHRRRYYRLAYVTCSRKGNAYNTITVYTHVYSNCLHLCFYIYVTLTYIEKVQPVYG